MVMGKLPVPGRPTNLDSSRARAYCACSRCEWGLFGHFFSRLSFLFSLSLSLGDGPIKTEILSQRAVKTKRTNQPTLLIWSPDKWLENGTKHPRPEGNMRRKHTVELQWLEHLWDHEN